MEKTNKPKIIRDKNGKKVFEFYPINPLKECKKKLETAPFGIIRSTDPYPLICYK